MNPIRLTVMPNKELRIIIADTWLSRRIQIEKLLNGLGYYRILPIQNIDDLWLLDHELIEPFDVLIVNNGYFLSSEINWNLLLRMTGKIHHSFSYDDKNILTGDDSLKRFMANIDAPSPWECLKDLKWIKEIYPPRCSTPQL